MTDQNQLIYRELQANLYDTNYKSKNYKLESEFIINTITNFSKKDSKEMNILDIGCGTGTHISFLSSYFANLVGVDSSSDMIHLAKQKYKQIKNVDFLCSDINDLKNRFTPNYFDIVTLLYSVSGYLGPVDNLISKIKNLSSIMKENAILILDYWDIKLLNYEYEIMRQKVLEFKDSQYKKISIGKIDPSNTFVDSNISWEKIGSNTKWSETHRVYCYNNNELTRQLQNINFQVILDVQDGKSQTPIIDQKSRWLVAIKLNAR
jgi:SAM-dependent methyltransferase